MLLLLLLRAPLPFALPTALMERLHEAEAGHKANISRLINSSCQPNCRSQKCVDAATGEVRVGIFAMRDIEAGEELSYNYQFQHFAHGEAAKTSFDCRCGAPNCIGTLDSTVKKRDEVKETVGKKIKVKISGDAGFEHLPIKGAKYAAANLVRLV